jgi:integrase
VVANSITSPVPLHLRRSLTLAEARDKARIGRDLAKAGLNPSAEWAAPVAETTPTFERAAREYHRHVSKGWRNGKHGAQWMSTLEAHAFPLIGSLPVDRVDASAIQSVLMPIWLTIPETARRVRQRIGVVLDYAKGKGWRETEAPMRALSQLMGGIKQPRGGNFAAMPYKDLPALMATLRNGDLSVGRLALQFLILTAARSGEVRKSKWEEIDLEAGEWRVPAGSTKTGKLHIVPLVPAAIDILNQMHIQFGGQPTAPIFPGLKGQPMSDATLAKTLRVSGGGSFTVHGMRSAFRDWAAESGFADAWAEAALAHGNPDRVEAAYKRTTFYMQRRDKLMPAWASFVLADGFNIISPSGEPNG